eukprot:TRINITY_DN16419_c0_g1_i1.p2 TRINITY_DN16419_c0_g1~~TRINITY_DN16419_c0_g1_i1.p2  ORF type:complete len:143 (+),score=34.53 TRINITY_DN16419_c0_g1_i1:64-429(+)
MCIRDSINAEYMGMDIQENELGPRKGDQQQENFGIMQGAPQKESQASQANDLQDTDEARGENTNRSNGKAQQFPLSLQTNSSIEEPSEERKSGEIEMQIQILQQKQGFQGESNQHLSLIHI